MRRADCELRNRKLKNAPTRSGKQTIKSLCKADGTFPKIPIRFYTKPEYRLQGIASEILKQFKDEAHRPGVVVFFLMRAFSRFVRTAFIWTAAGSMFSRVSGRGTVRERLCRTRFVGQKTLLYRRGYGLWVMPPVPVQRVFKWTNKDRKTRYQRNKTGGQFCDSLTRCSIHQIATLKTRWTYTQPS